MPNSAADIPNNIQDIVIVGAGPTGLALAAELHRLGHSALLIDRLAEGLNTSRAAIVHARTMEVLTPLGVMDDMLAQGLVSHRFILCERDKTLTTIDFKDLKTDYPYVLLLSQHATETILLKRLEALGGHVTRPCELIAFTEHPTHIELTYKCGDQSTTVRTRYLAACDGGKSLIREQSGIPFEGGEYEESFVLGDVEMDWPHGREDSYLFFSPIGIMIVVPLPGNHFRIVATVEKAPPLPTLEDLQQILNDYGPATNGGTITKLIWSSRFHIHHRLAQRFRKDRILLAGDAAHVHSPAGGQGMNTGIQDAIDLAHALHESLTDPDQADPILEAWQDKRHRIAKSVVDFTDQLTRAATSTNPIVHAARNAMLGLSKHLPFMQQAMATKISELNNK